MEIADWRAKIDGLDVQIVRMLNERAEAAIAIGDLKHTQKANIYEPDREQAVLANVKSANAGPLPETQLIGIYERILDVMRGLQRRG